jgi:hypothetical protein
VNTVDAYNKAVHGMAYVNPPNHDQTAARHGELAAAGKSVHRFPIAPDVKCTSKRNEAGLQNTLMSEPGLVFSDKAGEGCEPSGVYHFIEGREQRGHHGQVSDTADLNSYCLTVSVGSLHGKRHVL